MLLRASNAVGYSAYPDNVVEAFILEAAAQGIDIFRVFDSLNWMPNMKAPIEFGGKRTRCAKRDLLHGRFARPAAGKILAELLHSSREGGGKNGRARPVHQDMGGLCKPYAAGTIVHVLREEVGLPIHFHTHDTSGINAASILKAARSRRPRRGCGGGFDERHDEPAEPELRRGGAAAYGAGLPARPRCVEHIRRLLGDRRTWYRPFDNAPPAGTAEVYIHEMPGGQYTNLREQAESMGLGRAGMKSLARMRK